MILKKKKNNIIAPFGGFKITNDIFLGDNSAAMVF